MNYEAINNFSKLFFFLRNFDLTMLKGVMYVCICLSLFRLPQKQKQNKQIKKQRWCGFKNKYLSLTVLEAEKSQIKTLAYSCPVKA